MTSDVLLDMTKSTDSPGTTSRKTKHTGSQVKTLLRTNPGLYSYEAI